MFTFWREKSFDEENSVKGNLIQFGTHTMFYPDQIYFS